MDARPTAQKTLPDYRIPLVITFATSVAASSGTSLLIAELEVVFWSLAGFSLIGVMAAAGRQRRT